MQHKRSTGVFRFNSTDDIKQAFDPFYTATSLSEATDVNVLHELKDALDMVGVYEQAEVDDFVRLYFGNADAQQLSPFIDLAASRFEHELELDEQARIDFKIKAKQFVKIYGQMAAILPFEIIAWEKLFWFLKFLIPKLKLKDPDKDNIDRLLESVDLSSYGLERVKLAQAIRLDEEETTLKPQNPNPRGARNDPVLNLLDDIIHNFNERWFQGWSATPEEQRVKFISIATGIAQHPDFKSRYEDNADPYNRELAFEKMLSEIMLRKRTEELELYKLFINDTAFRAAFIQSMKQAIDQQRLGM